MPVTLKIRTTTFVEKLVFEQGVWVIENGHYVCHMVSVPPVFMPLTSLKLPTCVMQFPQSFFQVGNGSSKWDNTQNPFNSTLPHSHDLRKKDFSDMYTAKQLNSISARSRVLM
jgi:hypothetical protein